MNPDYSLPQDRIDVYRVDSRSRSTSYRLPLYAGFVERNCDNLDTEVKNLVRSLIPVKINKPGTFVVAITFSDRSHWFYTVVIEEKTTTNLVIV